MSFFFWKKGLVILLEIQYNVSIEGEYMRDDIINILKNSDKALDIYELQDLLGIISVEDIRELMVVLKNLEDDTIVYHSNKDKYMLLEKSHLRKGVMRANKKGFGFVEIENMDDDVYVSQENMNGSIHDDIVLVEITSKMTLDRLEASSFKGFKETS